MMSPLPYYCINCGHEEPNIYKTYADGNLIKLLKCKQCGELIDKYTEYDMTIIVLNLLLQNKMAYRHILLNTLFEGFWKLEIIFLFCEAYCFWCFQKGIEFDKDSVDFYELEIDFYQVLLRTLLGTILFKGLILLICVFRFKVFKRKIPGQFSYLTLLKGLCLSKYPEIFDLIALIWEFTKTQSRMMFVNGLFIFSNTNSYQVVTDASLLESVLVIMCSFSVQKLILYYYDIYFNL